MGQSTGQRSKERQPSTSPLLSGAAARSNQILARSLFNEMMRQGYSSTDVLEFVNCILGLLAEAAQRKPFPAVDTTTGLPTRKAFQELLLYELNAAETSERERAVLILQVSSNLDPRMAMSLLQQRLRREDIVTLLRPGLVAAVVYCPHSRLDVTRTRIEQDLSEGAGLTRGSFALVGCAVRPGSTLRRLWRTLLTELNARLTTAQPLAEPHRRRSDKSTIE